MKICVLDRTETVVGAYAVRELKTLLGGAAGVIFTDRGGELTFSVEQDVSLPESAWRVCRKGKTVHLSGHTEREALLAAYEALHILGFTFDTSTHAPATVEFLRLEGIDRTVKPFVRLRGVRQHINFPMDISSYPLDEAEEYIRSLARMRMNAITFHSYDGMWHRGAGHLFYGQGHPLSAAAFGSGKYREKLYNRELFFPPEGEALIREEEKLNRFAVERLRRLIAVAKEAGMHVTVSMELSHGDSVEEMIADVRELLTNYPEMDAVEWISPEGGDYGPELTVQNAAETVREMFGAAALGKKGEVTGLGEEIPPQLSGALESIRRVLLVWKRKDEVFSGLREIPVRAGLYVTDGQALRVTKAVMDRVLPQEITRVFLPGHGAEYQCSLVKQMKFRAKDWQHTVLHSWAEFDGNMYLLQNCSLGLEHLLGLIHKQANADSVEAFYVNHWRTAENAVCLAYSASAMISLLPSRQFYAEYAHRLGIPAEAFSQVMDKLAALDIYNRDHIFNIGFCYLNCWIGPKGISWLDGMEEAGMAHARGVYAWAEKKLLKLLEETKTRDGIACLRLLANRCGASIYHISGIECLKQIGKVFGTSVPENPSAMQVIASGELCREAEEFFDQYVALHAECMPDRGCEGTLISYLCTMPVYAEHIKTCVLGGKTPCTHRAPKAAIIAPV